MSALEATTTIVGRVQSGGIDLTATDSGTLQAFFWVQVSRYHSKNGHGRSVDFKVRCTGALARNVAQSVKPGDVVVVVGELGSRRFVGRDGRQYVSVIVHAVEVAPSLCRATVQLASAEAP